MSSVFSYLRWSSQAQTLGDSERRQLQQAADWCARRGLKLSDRSFTDRGVSAKAGKNLEEGALGELVRVAKSGDVLLIEDNDRFSRQSPITALSNLSAVVNKGISVVFLRTGVEVNQQNFNDMSVIVPNFFGALLANQENEKRAFRIRQSWEKRYAELRSGKPTRMKLPGWLKWQDDKVVLIEERAATVREIFRLALNGWGFRRIAQKLNAEGVPTVSGQAPHWNGRSLLHCILNNVSVCGHYQVLKDKKPTGEVIRNLYPPVVSEETFYSVQSNKNRHAQRSAPARSASTCLTTGLTFCPSCGGPLIHKSTHNGEKLYKYLVCAAHQDGQSQSAKPECKKRISYPLFESSLLALLSNSKAVREALGQPSGEPSAMAALRGRVNAADAEANKLWKLIEDDPNPAKRLAEALKAAEQKAEVLRAELLKAEQELKATTPPQAAYSTLLKLTNDDEHREQFKACLRDVIEKVQFTSTSSFDLLLKGVSEPIKVAMAETSIGWTWGSAAQEKLGLGDTTTRHLALLRTATELAA